jgi:ABC-type transport system involved in multi-copper enzyme maturation permease subunit
MKTRGDYGINEINEANEKSSIFRLLRTLPRIFRIEPDAPQIWRIAKREIIANIRNFKIPVAFVTMTLMLLVSAHMMALDYQQRLNNWTVNQISQHDAVIGGRVTYDLSDGSFFHSAVIGHGPPILRPQSLSVLIKGMDSEVDRAVSINDRIIFGARQDKPVTSALFDTVDTSYVIKLLVSLFALLFSLAAVTHEKETGTLRAMLAQSVRRRELILYKSLGASISLIIPFAIAYLVEIIYLHFAHGLLNSKEDMVRAVLIFCLGALYGIVFVHIGLFISTMVAQTKIAVAMALLVWATTVLVLPNVAVLMAKLLSPAPSYSQFNVRLDGARQQILRAEIQGNPADKPLPGLRTSKQAMFRIFDVERQLTDDYLASKKAQIYQARLLATLSPSGALTFGLSDLAGTGVSAYSSYLELLRSGRDTMMDALKRRLDLPPQAGAKLVQDARDMIDSRQRDAEPLGASFRSAVISITSLLAWAVLFGLAAYWRFERYDVR